MPPPPPLPPPGPGPPKGVKLQVKSSGGPADRNALLSSIQMGAKLKKTVTNDRSAPVVNDKIVKTPVNGAIQTPSGGGGISNGGAPQLAGLFAGGMPKLRPTGKGRTIDTTDSSSTLRAPLGGGSVGAPLIPMGKKPSAPPTPPENSKPTQSSQPYMNHNNDSSQSHSNGYLPPSPKPSSKSSPAPPPPPSNRKPTLGLGSRAPPLDIPPPTSKPVAPKTSVDANGERHPPLPTKPSFKARPEPGYRGAPPRPPSSSKPNVRSKSPDLNQQQQQQQPAGEPRRPSIDRSVSLREPFRPPLPQTRVGTSAESPAAPFRVSTNHREAPPIPSSRPPQSKTVGRAAGFKLLPGLKPPSDRPPRPPLRPVVAAPPPPSQPPPPPPSHRAGAMNPPPSTTPSHRVGPMPPIPTPTPTLSHRLGTGPSPAPTPTPGGKADVPLPPLPHNTPPPPPERNESTRTTTSRLPGDFESKYSNQFKSRHQLPLPLVYNSVPKIYPSKSNGKNQRRAPLPPTSSQPPSGNTTTTTSPPPNSSSKGYTSSFLHPSGGGGPPPPPPPPHAPLHLQMERKFYVTEASHC